MGFNGISAHRLAALLPFTEEQPVHQPCGRQYLDAAVGKALRR